MRSVSKTDMLPRNDSLPAAGLVTGLARLRLRLRLAEGGLKSSIHRVSWEQAYLPLTPGHRGTAKLIIDGAASRIAEGAAALLLFAWMASVAEGADFARQDLSWITYALLIFNEGRVVETIVGLVDKQHLTRVIAGHLS